MSACGTAVQIFLSSASCMDVCIMRSAGVPPLHGSQLPSFVDSDGGCLEAWRLKEVARILRANCCSLGAHLLGLRLH